MEIERQQTDRQTDRQGNKKPCVLWRWPELKFSLHAILVAVVVGLATKVGRLHRKTLSATILFHMTYTTTYFIHT